MAQPPGFMIYAEDWTEAAEDFTVNEIGEMLLGLLHYFQTGEVTEFTDRAMKQFYKSAIKGISRDAEKYQDRCLKNSYSRYKGICKEKGIEPLEFDEWTIENNRQRSSTDVTNSNSNPNDNSNSNPNTQNQMSSCKGESPEGGSPRKRDYALTPEMEYENKRSAALAKLGL